MKKDKKPGNPRSVRFLTLSKYYLGRHHFNEEECGEPSFAESMNPLHMMLRELHAQGGALGGQVVVTMEMDAVRGRAKKRKEGK